jgi:hypothetical protein
VTGTLGLILLPRIASDYAISLSILLYACVALSTAWAFFSGSTRYISLATAATFEPRWCRKEHEPDAQNDGFTPQEDPGKATPGTRRKKAGEEGSEASAEE